MLCNGGAAYLCDLKGNGRLVMLQVMIEMVVNRDFVVEDHRFELLISHTMLLQYIWLSASEKDFFMILMHQTTMVCLNTMICRIF